LLFEKLSIEAGRKTDYLESLRELADDAEGIDADGAR
jgi:hypothetical protein